MLMRTKIMIGSGLAALAIASGCLGWGIDHAAAQSTSAPVAQTTATPVPNATAPTGRGQRQERRQGALGAAVLIKTTADLTKQSREDVVAQLQGGQSLAQIASAHGSSGDAVVQAATATAKAQFDKAVSAGRITQAQADQRLSQFTTQATRLVNDTKLGTQIQQRVARRGREELIDATARLTGLQRQEIVTDLRNGQSIAAIAAAHGSSGDAVVNAVVDKLKVRLAQVVSKGRITQAQADQRLAQARTKLTAAVNQV